MSSNDEIRRPTVGVSRRWWGLWMGVVLVAAVGCSSGDTSISLQTVDSSAGGAVATVAAVDVDDTTHLVAPTGSDLYVRSVDSDDWDRRPAQWPMSVDEPGLDLFYAVGQATRHAKFGPEDYFAVVDNRLWTVALPAAGQPATLVYSDDVGRSWQVVTPPGQSDSESVASGPHQSTMEPAMRLLPTEDALYVFDGEHLWHKEALNGEIEEGQRDVDWREVSLEGTVLEDGVDDLPAQLHHYLPADEYNDYELVTVHGRDLRIYRRGDDEQEFREVAILDGVDRDLVRRPGVESLYLVDTRAIYRSDDRGSSWESIEVARDSLEPETYRRLELVEDEEAEAGYELWLIGDHGGLWRSDDGGREWIETRSRDADRRGVTGLIFSEAQSAVWAATDGRGVLRSDDGGEHWREDNSGLHGAETRDAILAGPDRIFVGTDAGLYERTSVGTDDQFRLDDRAVSALYFDEEYRRLLAGTAGGGIELFVDGQRQESSQVAAVDDGDEVVFEPPHRASVTSPHSAILELVVRPESTEMIAWSHRRGPVISSDAGATWRRLQIGDAFRQATEGSVITHFLAMRDQTYFAVTEPRRRHRPAQLWRSDDGGSTWQTAHAFREHDHETPLNIALLPDDQGLVVAHGSRMAISTDRGQTWSQISGPWEGGVTTGLAVDGDQVVVAMDMAHAAEVAWVDDIVGDPSVAQRHRLRWPTTRSLDVHAPLGLEVLGERVVIHEGDRVLRGDMPRRADGSMANVSLVVALGAVMALTTLAFGYLRRWEMG